MIESIRGRLAALHDEGAIVEVGGLGLLVQVPAGLRSRLDTLLEGTADAPTIHLATHLLVRPESWQLFAFVDRAQRDLFRVLLGITGIGPRVAMNILSHLSFDEIRAALEAGEASRFAAVPGIGKRTAARIVLELSGKLKDAAGAAIAVGRTPVIQDAIDALVSLGVAQPEAVTLIGAAAREAGENDDPATLVAAALRRQRSRS
ncbi:MAG: Holliday junction branch migration protein RuvA [Candidatus Eisenbacteria sp.]|nr:Holliday junction branch migration protein RuvA [Candidatus Eisenbacteria bacterium]